MTDASICYGSLVFMKNSCKSPQHQEYPARVLEKVEPDRIGVFQWAHEFVAYHSQPMKKEPD